MSERLLPENMRDAEEEIVGRTPRIGVALSGGGIRSATFSLGFFQGLAAHSLLRHVDIISTVSGGGYFGAFFGHLIRRAPTDPPGTDPPSEGAPGPDPDDVPDARSIADEVLRDPRAPAVRFLRDNGRYLAPEGAGDFLAAAAVAVRNWASILVVLILPILSLSALVLLVGLEVESWVTRLTSRAWTWPIPWLSPYFLFAGLAVPVFLVPPAWAYWLVPDQGRGTRLGTRIAQWLAPVAAAVLVVWRFATSPEWGAAEWLIAAVGGTAGLTMARYWLAASPWASRRRGGGDPEAQRDELSRGLKRALVVVGILLFWGVVDTIAQGIVEIRHVGIAAAYAALAAVAGTVRNPLLRLATSLGANDSPPPVTAIGIHVAAAVILFGVLGGVASIPHFLVSGELPRADVLPRDLGGALGGTRDRLLLLAGASAVLAFASGRIWSFVNRSSMHALYEARLRRAYLGASNPERRGEGEDRPPLAEPHPDDGMSWPEYVGPADDGSANQRNMAPLHLINVTINETVDGRSQVQQRDRKGVGMAVGPAGISVGRTHHALWQTATRSRGLWHTLTGGVSTAFKHMSGVGRRRGEDASSGSDAGPSASTGFRVFPGDGHPELLNVGQWVAISGGAVSTGLGARTNLSLSLLCGFFNVRLGYWWHSGVDPHERVGVTRTTRVAKALAAIRTSMPVQSALVDEWLARFPGTSRPDWYLSDGGHFENLGGYELIRRRLPLIIVCDNEQDADYNFQGLANLMRKARIDLAAEIEFLTDDEIRELRQDWRAPIGSLDALRRGRRTVEKAPAANTERPRTRVDVSRDDLSIAHAAVARITYRDFAADGTELDPSYGVLLYVKPSLDGDEAADVIEYHRGHRDFPHESTADQFFDEAQWESYRNLGEHVAEKLFSVDNGLREELRKVSAGDDGAILRIVRATTPRPALPPDRTGSSRPRG